MKIMGQVAVYPTPGPEIARLTELAYNLWWSWNPAAQALYEGVDAALWKQVKHNPVKFLRRVSQARLDRAAADREYVARYQAVMASFDAYMHPPAGSTWYAATHGEPAERLIAYFSAEFGLHESLAHLLRRPGHSIRRSLQGSQRSGAALRRRGIPLPAGLFRAAD